MIVDDEWKQRIVVLKLKGYWVEKRGAFYWPIRPDGGSIGQVDYERLGWVRLWHHHNRQGFLK